MIDSFAVAAPDCSKDAIGVIKIGQRKAVIINLQIASIEMTGTSHLRRDKLKLRDKEVCRLSQLERTVVIVVPPFSTARHWVLGHWGERRKKEGRRKRVE